MYGTKYKVRDRNGKEMWLFEDYDESSLSPREAYEPPTKFYTWLRGHISPDSRPPLGFADFLREEIGGSGIDEAVAMIGEGNMDDGIKKLVSSALRKGYVLLPVWKYEHGGVIYKASVSCPFSDAWDSCLAGVIYMTKDVMNEQFLIYKNYKTRKAHAVKTMQWEVDMYSEWADGNVHMYAVGDGGEDESGEALEWVAGYYGDIKDNGILAELDVEVVEGPVPCERCYCA